MTWQMRMDIGRIKPVEIIYFTLKEKKYMKKSEVVLAVCDSYDEEKVYAAVRGAVEALGGIGRFVSAEENILVKPNLLYPSKEEKCITTNPAVIKAVLRILSEEGCTNVKVGDSSAYGSCRQAMNQLGLPEDQLYGARIADMSHEVLVQYPEGKAAKSFWFCEEVVQADALIGVCKMKSHAFMKITGAVKNLYGLVCGMRKARGHVVYPNEAKFAQMLVDIHRLTKPRLHVMDAVIAMEGNGPSSGSPRDMGLIIVSADPVAIDTVFARLVNLNPGLVLTNTHGMIAGIGTCNESEIALKLIDNGGITDISFDEMFARFGKEDFDVCRKKDKVNILGLLSRITGRFSKRPYIDADMCVKCGMCVSHCPVEGHAVTFKNGKDNIPVYDYRKCIRCFCCQEICPQHAIKVK